MRLQISNFAKINVADISINGITVIAGNNNTGKSTVGKILSSIFDSMHNINSALKKARFRNINRELTNYVIQNLDTKLPSFSHSSRVFISNFSKNLVYDSDKYEILLSNFINSVNAFGKKNEVIFNEDNIAEIRSITQNVLKIPDETLMKSIISMYFQDVFNEQINNIETPSKKADVQLTVKQKEVKLSFKDDSVDYLKSDLFFTNSAIYIDNPSVLDRLNERSHYFTASSEGHSLSQELLDKLRLRTNKFQYEDEALNRALISGKLSAVFEKMIGIVPGEMIYDNRYKYKYKKNVEPIDVNSLSTGLKSFVLLKQLLLNSSLKEKDVLVLDEPEIHLHPEWQLKYAEIIVLLQKAFDLNIVITTHSSHFLEALDLFATIHSSKQVCNYYLAQMNQENGRTDFIDATDNIEKIYSNLVSPSLAIDTLKARMGLLND